MFISIISFVLVLGLLVLVHELGHFLVAKKFGVWSDEFGFGFPPRIGGVQVYKKNGKKTYRFIKGNRDLTDDDKQYGTVYSLNWIPLGGFVKIKGENGQGEETKKEDKADSFPAKPIWQRTLILAAGVLMNVVLAFVLLVIGLMIGMPLSVEDSTKAAEIKNHEIQIFSVVANSPASEAGLKTDDIIITVNDQEFKNVPSLQEFTSTKENQELTYKLKRANEVIEKKITPKKLTEIQDKVGIGVSIMDIGTVRYSFGNSVIEAAKLTGVMLKNIFVGFYDLFGGLLKGQPMGQEVSGPVGIAKVAGQMAERGFVYLLQFTVVLSLNLAVINILPIPALDGGRIVFLIIEAIRRKPLKPEIEAMINNIFFLALLFLVAWITFMDIAKLGCWTCYFSRIFN